MTKDKIEQLISFLIEEIENISVIDKIKAFQKNGKSSAGTSNPEEIFTREFLCPTIYKFFNTQLEMGENIDVENLDKFLGTEGFKKCPGFGFSPATGKKHIVRKDNIGTKGAPKEWLMDSKSPVPAYQPCPDFAIKTPLLNFNTLGESKYFTTGTHKSAANFLFTAVMEIIFYLGMFSKEYDTALIVVADASPKHIFKETVAPQTGKIHPEIMRRFGFQTNIFLATIALS